MSHRNEYYVNYTLLGRDYQFGPFLTMNKAWENWRGMKSFPSVTHCSIIKERESFRTLIREEEAA